MPSCPGRWTLPRPWRQGRVLLVLGVVWAAVTMAWVCVSPFYSKTYSEVDVLENQLSSHMLSHDQHIDTSDGPQRLFVISNGNEKAMRSVIGWLHEGHTLGLLSTQRLPPHVYEEFDLMPRIAERLILQDSMAGCRYAPLDVMLRRVSPQGIRILLGGDPGDQQLRQRVADDMECVVRVFEVIYKDENLRHIPIHIHVDDRDPSPNDQLGAGTRTGSFYSHMLELMSKPYTGVRHLKINFTTL